MEDKLITAQMMDDLNYNSDDNVLDSEENCLKNVKGVERLIFSMREYSLDEVAKIINENINTLAKLEAEGNCLPYKIAKENIRKAVSYMTLEDVSIDPENLRSAVRATRFEVRILSHNPISRIFRAIVIVLAGMVPELSIVYDAPRKKWLEFLFQKLPKCEKIHHSEYQEETQSPEPYATMFVFQSSDLDAAVYYLTKSFEDPTNELNVKTVYVQESCLNRFSKKLEQQLRPYPCELLRDNVFIEKNKELQNILNKLKATTIKPLNTKEEIVPTVCSEFDLKYFPDFSPVLVMKAFRTVKEAITLAKQENIRGATIWTQNHSTAYEIVNDLNCGYFWINCLGVESKMWKTVSLLISIAGIKQAFKIIPTSGDVTTEEKNFTNSTKQSSDKYTHIANQLGVGQATIFEERTKGGDIP